MKRRQRRPILDIDGEDSNSPVRLWQDKYQQIAHDHPEENGSSNNPLKGLLGQYNSDSETEDMQQPSNKLNDKVNDFLKEIQSIVPENLDSLSKGHGRGKAHSSQPEMPWQECFDESTGYPYYWHIESNQVTWEMPPEYRLWKERSEMTANPHNLHLSHWPGVSSNAYPKPQTEIPEGMIPKEVVARNRNRQAGIQQSQVQSIQEKSENLIPPHLRDDDSDDGKIEMITSFGNEESEESESDTNDKTPESKPKKPQDRKPSEYSSREKKSDPKPVSKHVAIGPCLPPEMMSKVQSSIAKDTTITSELENSLCTKSSSNQNSSSVDTESSVVEDDILRRLKNQAKLLQLLDGNPQNVTEISQKSSPRGGSPIEVERNKQSKKGESEKRSEEKKQSSSSEFKISLVPGYEDDSENEDEAPPMTEVKPLFPIVEHQSDKSLPTGSSDLVVKKVETKLTDSGCIRIFEYRNTESGKTDTPNVENKESNKETDNVENSESESRVAQPTQEAVKVNKFLENLETPTKAFQRKKRIAFDVLPNRPKAPETQVTSSVDELQSTNALNEGERFGFGFQKEKPEESCDESDELKPTETSTKPEKDFIGFVKGETMSSSTKLKEEVKIIPAADNREFKYLTEMITEKLKFLAEGCQMASAVQIMAIQLQTLLDAWEAGDLKQTYLHQWLTATGRELSRLEQTAAPSGWECQWDRSHKRYYYRNAANGAAQWTYPDMDVIGGSEEMELCTTPPPEHEEPAIIERDAEQTKKDSGPDDEEKKLSLEVQETFLDSSDIKVPPPPQISSPSPPPPPRICAEDMKRGKKRKGSQEKDSDDKKEKIEQSTSTSNANSTNPPLPTTPAETIQPPLPPSSPKASKSSINEPLPPGVDPPEMPYALPASVLESGVLYAAAPHQNNPIYAATMGNAILTHHTALMQGQLLHYPTYHHLHNQAIVAAANRLGQEGVQFMMADYSQIYGTNQVIAKPPVKAQRESLGSAIDSFYNDIASIENTKSEIEPEKQESSLPDSVSSPMQPTQPEVDQSSSSSEAVAKEKKKKKTKLGLGKKQKEMSSMVAKWQRVQQNFGNGS